MTASHVAQVLEALGPSCRDSRRRSLLLAQTVLGGIDFVEFEVVLGKNVLHVHFLGDLPPDAYGLHADPSAIRVLGGTRIFNVSVTDAVASTTDLNVLDVTVDQQGDFSPYLLTIGWGRDAGGEWRYGVGTANPRLDHIDRLFSVAPVNFRPGCPVDFDCQPVVDCPPDTYLEPTIDYLAKDYASFRQMLLDLVAQRNPAFTERSAADLGIALLELFAHEGDHLSYFQDAVANEAYLDTARQRVSAKRHAKLIDYTMHDGRNAWTYVHLNVSTKGTIDPGRQLVTRIEAPMRFDRVPLAPAARPTRPPGTLLHRIDDDDYRTDPALAQVRAFETAATCEVDPRNNDLRIHTWGNEECCLAEGATTAHVYAVNAAGTTAVRPPLVPGDWLLFEEVRGPTTGASADADPTHRQVVKIVHVNPDTTATASAADLMHDRLFLADIDPTTGEAKPATTAVPLAQTLPLLEVTWDAADALAFPLCVAAKLADGTAVHRASVARGNIALADHGRSTIQTVNFDPPLDGSPTFRLRLAEGPLTMQRQPDTAPNIYPPIFDRPELAGDVRVVKPAVALRARRSGVSTGDWWPVPDLLSSTEFSHHFVVDVDDSARGVLRFGDGEYGERLLDVDQLEVWYRIGNGPPGNIGADSLAHIVLPFPPVPSWPSINFVRNPIPARDGIDAELIEEVRQHAPAEFRATQFRAVTEHDYEQAALRIAGVAGAVARFRWTGSWYTVFVAIDPSESENVITDVRGLARLDPRFEQLVAESLTSYRLAGYDLELRAARYVPLDIAINICAKRGYFAADVAHGVSIALSSGSVRAGVPGFFNPEKFTFGQPVYLSQIYATVEDVEGVESATVTEFHPHGHPPADEIANGSVRIGPWEIARLDNDPSNMENGTLTVTAGGGS
ncbi:MAG: hypothetical protein ACXVL8_02685 [Acidimicrobiia bacterium]